MCCQRPHEVKEIVKYVSSSDLYDRSLEFGKLKCSPAHELWPVTVPVMVLCLLWYI